MINSVGEPSDERTTNAGFEKCAHISHPASSKLNKHQDENLLASFPCTSQGS